MDEEISVLKKKLVDIPNPFEIDKVHGLTHEVSKPSGAEKGL